MRYYSGIGSRQTPDDILQLMDLIATELVNESPFYMLRSGGAAGADQAFKDGSEGSHFIYRPENATEEAIKIAMEHHPTPHKCNKYVKKLHGRNTMIVLGPNLKEPSDFVACWTPNAKTIGGTGLGIRIAQAHNIPVFNLARAETRELFERYAGEGRPLITIEEILAG